MLKPSNDDSNFTQTDSFRDINKSPSINALERRRGSLFRLDIRPSIRLQQSPATMGILPATERRASIVNIDLQEIISSITDFEDKEQVLQAMKGLPNMKDKLKTIDIILEQRRKAKQKRFRRKVAKATTFSSLMRPKSIVDKGPTATNLVNQFRKKLIIINSEKESESPASEEGSKFLELISQKAEPPKPRRSRLGLLSQIKKEDSDMSENQDDTDESIKLVFPIEEKGRKSPKMQKGISPKGLPKNIRDALQMNESSPMQRLKMKNLTSITELAERRSPAQSATLRKRSSQLNFADTPDRSPQRKISLAASDSQGELGLDSTLRRNSIRKASLLDSPIVRSQIKRDSIRASALLRSRMQKDLRIESPSLKSQVNDLNGDALSQSQGSSKDLSPTVSLPRKSILKNFESLTGRNFPSEVGGFASPVASIARGGFTSRFIKENLESRPTTGAQTSRSTVGRKSLIPKPPKNAIREETYQLAGKELQDSLYRYLLNNENHIVNQAVVKCGKVMHKKMRNIEREAYGKFEEHTHQENIMQQESARQSKFKRTDPRTISNYVNTAPTTRENSQLSSPRDFRISAIRTSSFVRLVHPQDLIHNETT